MARRSRQISSATCWPVGAVISPRWGFGSAGPGGCSGWPGICPPSEARNGLDLEGPGGRPTPLKGGTRPIADRSGPDVVARCLRAALTTQLTRGAPDYAPVGTAIRRLIRLFGRVVDREPRELHVDPLASERDALGFEEPALTLPFGQRPVGAHDALPRNVGVLARGHYRAGEARR